MPGVSTGGGNNAFDARINGGLQSGDEASVDGVSMQQGFMSQGGMVSIFQDFPMSPDMVSEVKVLTSNYAPEYGSSTSGQIMAVTKSGGSSFHGVGVRVPPRRLAEGEAVGRGRESPVQAQQLRRQHRRPGQGPGAVGRQAARATSTSTTRATGRRAAPTSRRCRSPRSRSATATSRDWRDANGNLIPIYDPLTIRPDGRGGYIKDQFMGCDGNQPERDLPQSHQRARAAVAARRCRRRPAAAR